MRWQWLLQPPTRLAWWIALLLVTVFVIRVCSDIAHGAPAEPDWYQWSHQCTDETAKKIGGCGSCSAQWEAISRCTIKRIAEHAVPPQKVSPWIVDACVAIVKDRLPASTPGYVDRITPMVKCVRQQ